MARPSFARPCTASSYRAPGLPQERMTCLLRSHGCLAVTCHLYALVICTFSCMRRSSSLIDASVAMSLLKVFKSEKYRASPVPSHQQTYNEEEELEMLIDSTFPLPRAEGIKRSRISDRFRSCALLCAGALAFFSIQAAFFRTSSHRDLTGPEATYTHPLLPVRFPALA